MFSNSIFVKATGKLYQAELLSLWQTHLSYPYNVETIITISLYDDLPFLSLIPWEIHTSIHIPGLQSNPLSFAPCDLVEMQSYYHLANTSSSWKKKKIEKKKEGESGELGMNRLDFNAQKILGLNSQAICLLAPRI